MNRAQAATAKLQNLEAHNQALEHCAGPTHRGDYVNVSVCILAPSSTCNYKPSFSSVKSQIILYDDVDIKFVHILMV